MKKSILTSVTVLIFCFAATAQDTFLGDFNFIDVPNSTDLSFWVEGKYERPIYKEKLEKANLISDFIDGFPSNWIEDYISVEVLVTSNGKSMQATGINEQLTHAQKSLLSAADISSDIFINVKYNAKSAATNDLLQQEVNIMAQVININMTIIPDIEAEFAGGKTQLTAYLKEVMKDKIPETVAKSMNIAQVFFTINENGEIENATIHKTSGNQETDQVLVEAINKMPKWKPAKNAQGKQVKQEFRLNVGKPGC